VLAANASTSCMTHAHFEDLAVAINMVPGTPVFVTLSPRFKLIFVVAGYTGHKPAVVCHTERPGGIPLCAHFSRLATCGAKLLQDGQDDNALHHHADLVWPGGRSHDEHARVTTALGIPRGTKIGLCGESRDTAKVRPTPFPCADSHAPAPMEAGGDIHIYMPNVLLLAPIEYYSAGPLARCRRRLGLLQCSLRSVACSQASK
jgi:hypothetical protein